MSVFTPWEDPILSTTAVRWQSETGHPPGQSVLEFLMMLPMMLGFVLIMMKVNTAIQMSIVDQQYARAQALFITYNSAFYPTLNNQKRLYDYQVNQMIVGVSENAAEASGDKEYTPKASVQMIARKKSLAGSDEAKTEPAQRGLVRIRNSVTLCAPTVFVGGGNKPVRILDLKEDFTGNGRVNLAETTELRNFCGARFKYE